MNTITDLGPLYQWALLQDPPPPYPSHRSAHCPARSHLRTACGSVLPSQRHRPGGWTMKRLHVTVEVIDGAETRTLALSGRDGWALCELVKAGPNGCTPLTHVGPRWSAYVFKLRRKYGIRVESINERHGGQFAGKHVRYVLRALVRIVATNEARAA
jgi:hypothetical protein